MKCLSLALCLLIGAAFFGCEASQHVTLEGLERQPRSTVGYTCNDPTYYDQLANSKQAACNATVASATAALLSQKDDCIAKKNQLLNTKKAELSTCTGALNAMRSNCDFGIQQISFQLAQCGSLCPVVPTSLTLTTLSTGKYYFGQSGELKSWYMANKFCKSHGLELASVESKFENDVLITQFGSTSDRFWISGTDLGSISKFYWSGSGKMVDPFTYFEVNQPDSAGNNKESCLQFFVHPTISGATWKWNDEDCITPYRFICELESTKSN